MALLRSWKSNSFVTSLSTPITAAVAGELVQHPLKEKPVATDSDGHGVAGVMLEVLEIEEVLAQFFSSGAASQVGCTALLFGLVAGG